MTRVGPSGWLYVLARRGSCTGSQRRRLDQLSYRADYFDTMESNRALNRPAAATAVLFSVMIAGRPVTTR